MKGLRLWLKNKVFYSRMGGSYRRLGPALDFAKRARSLGFGLLHIIDRDLASGIGKNLDVYDALTRFIHVQVELPRPCFDKELYSLNARIAFTSPNIPKDINYRFSLLKTEEPKELVRHPGFRDILTSSEDVAGEAIRLKKRVFFIGKSEGAFCEISDPP